jgi:16S rRNA (adenine1518-N6/adenine1519-N6)-dimethyltransferase
MHKARKRFGQNFLHDFFVIDRIVSSIAPKPGQHVVEIGPGQGAITAPLLKALDGVLEVVELDRDLIPILRTQFVHYPGLTIHEADALTFDYRSLATDDRQLRMVGNLPYNISTPLMFHLLENSDLIFDMHFMLQKEVVQRLCAAPGENAYGRLGIMMQYRCETRYMFTVPPEAFTPSPKVESAIVRLTPRKTIPYPAKDFEMFARVVKAAFAQRRKTIKNNLQELIDVQGLIDLGIKPSHRAETLSIETFVHIANHISQ